ncbi:MAG: hypothetical protein P1P66_04815 [Treponema pedis]
MTLQFGNNFIHIKHKNKVYIIGMLTFTIGIIALSSDCSQTKEDIRYSAIDRRNGKRHINYIT